MVTIVDIGRALVEILLACETFVARGALALKRCGISDARGTVSARAAEAKGGCSLALSAREAGAGTVTSVAARLTNADAVGTRVGGAEIDGSAGDPIARVAAVARASTRILAGCMRVALVVLDSEGGL